MKRFKSRKGIGIISLLSITILVDLIVFFFLYKAETYELIILLKFLLFFINIFQFYYILSYSTLKYNVDDESINISLLFGLKKIKIPFNEIDMYDKTKGILKGVRLSGYGTNHFAIGKSIIDKIGTTYMFVTSNKNVFYLKKKDICYALSPDDNEAFEDILKNKGIVLSKWNFKVKNSSDIFKDKIFLMLLIFTSIIIIAITINPLMYYIKNKLPVVMPISFNKYFIPVKQGTSRQFVFRQMTYGALNMVIFICMYYASFFCAKYDKKSKYNFIFISLVISMIFLIFQIKILLSYGLK